MCVVLKLLGFEYIPIVWISTLVLRAIAWMLPGEKFFKGDIEVGYGARIIFIFVLNNLYCFVAKFGSHGTAASQKYVLRDRVSTRCTLFLYGNGFL